MNPVNPHSSGPPAQPTPEAWAVRAGWREQPPSLALEEAGRALEALDRAAAEAAGRQPAEDIPPIPQSLRDRWAETYGAAAIPAPPRPATQVRRDRRLADWLAAALRPRRMAWAGGLAAALALLVLVSRPDGATSVGGPASPVPKSRGAGVVSPGSAAPVAVVVPATASEAKAAVLDALRQAYPVRSVRVLATADEAAALARGESRLVVVNLASGLVTAWRSGVLAEEFPSTATVSPAGVIGQIESADELLEQPAPAAP